MRNLLPPFKGGGGDSKENEDSHGLLQDTDTAPLSISHLHWRNINYEEEKALEGKAGDGKKVYRMSNESKETIDLENQDGLWVQKVKT